MRLALKYICTLSLLFIMSSCNEETLKPAMVDFDQAFIPVLYYTYVGDMESAERAMLVLDRRWKKLNSEFDKHAMSTHNGIETFQMVGTWLQEADCAIQNKDTLLALIQLDHARYEMVDFRWREGISYYLDKVWDLEATIDIAVQTVNDPMLDLMEWPEFIPMCYDVENAWKEMSKVQVDETLYGFSKSDKEQITLRLADLEFYIQNFMNTIDCADSCKVAEAANLMEAAYLDYLYLFGDFESSKSYFAVK